MSGRHKWDTLRQKVIERLGQERYDEMIVEAKRELEASERQWREDNPEEAAKDDAERKREGND